MKFSNIIFAFIFTVFFQAGICRASVPHYRIVLDPGHGGSDQGTVYKTQTASITEKELTLTLAQQVAQKLKKHGFTAILTRNHDQSLSLPERTAIANRLKANLFLSIHLNSSPFNSPTIINEEASGFETYILNNATDASSRRLAHFENTIVTPYAKDSPEQLDVALILKDLRLDANLTESERLACNIQDRLIAATSRLPLKNRNRGVKQALFHVLLGADMPSALLEAGFLSNPKDRSILLSSHGRDLMSSAITRAIETFLKSKGSPKSRSMLSRCKVN